MLDTITEDVGRAVPAEDPAALAEAMAAILSNPQMAAQMGRRGRDRAAAQFTWRARAARMLAVYEQVCSRRTPSRAA
jgi:starch synthase